MAMKNSGWLLVGNRPGRPEPRDCTLWIVSHFPAARFLTSAAAKAQFPPDAGAEIAFAGRSNSGKSTAINRILARNGLARVSKTPGRTRLLNFFEIRPGQRIVDLPGYGYAAASAAERATWEPMITALAQRQCMHGLLLIVDARRGLMSGDMELLDWAESASLPVHVLLSKSDKLKRNEMRTVEADAARALGTRATVQAFSAMDGTGIDAAREWLEKKLPPEKKMPR
jgi:GTP-binding protein